MAPPGIRPTQGLIKGAIFNMLGPAVLEARVLDLYAGSGGLGIEALSRGAAFCTFVERSGEGVLALQRNLSALDYADRATVVRAALPRWLRSTAGGAAAAEASLVLADPPYEEEGLDSVLTELDRSLTEGALLVVEHASRRALPALERLQVEKSRRHGGTSVTIARAANR